MTTTDQPHNAATVLAVILLLLFIVKIVAKELLNDIVYVYHWIRQIATDTVPKDDITSTSALRYFCASFNHPELLIKVMAKNNFVLSGSRALEYFVPGSTSMTSDWDFYIPNNEACIAGAMHTLAKCGVVWTDWIAPFRNLLDAEKEETLHTNWKTAQFFANSWVQFHKSEGSNCDATLASLMDAVSSAVADIVAGFAKSEVVDRVVKVEKAIVHIHASTFGYNTASCSTTVEHRENRYGPKVHIVRGTTTFNGTSETVQLISGSGKSPIDLILAFYASHVQCFVSAFGAAHLYLPNNKIATTWPLNTQHRPSAEAALQKYKQRGFSFESKGGKHGERKLRQLSDPTGQAKLVEFKFDFGFDGVPDAVVALRRQALKKLMWIETTERTWRVADGEVEEGMKQWIRARTRRVASAIAKDPYYEEKTDAVEREGASFYKGVVSAADMRQARDSILLF